MEQFTGGYKHNNGNETYKLHNGFRKTSSILSRT